MDLGRRGIGPIGLLRGRGFGGWGFGCGAVGFVNERFANGGEAGEDIDGFIEIVPSAFGARFEMFETAKQQALGNFAGGVEKGEALWGGGVRHNGAAYGLNGPDGPDGQEKG